MRRAFVNGHIHAAGTFLTGHALLVDGGYIEAIVPEDDARLAGAEHHDLDDQLLLPGFIDTQVNGGGGVLFNDKPTVEGIRAIGAAHAPGGTTGFLPTLIAGAQAAGATELPTVRVPGVLAPIVLAPSLYRMLARLAIARGHDPDSPPHLRKVTETL